MTPSCDCSIHHPSTWTLLNPSRIFFSLSHIFYFYFNLPYLVIFAFPFSVKLVSFSPVKLFYEPIFRIYLSHYTSSLWCLRGRHWTELKWYANAQCQFPTTLDNVIQSMKWLNAVCLLSDNHCSTIEKSSLCGLTNITPTLNISLGCTNSRNQNLSFKVVEIRNCFHPEGEGRKERRKEERKEEKERGNEERMSGHQPPELTTHGQGRSWMHFFFSILPEAKDQIFNMPVYQHIGKPWEFIQDSTHHLSHLMFYFF